jgi:hypothetical protein
LCSFQSDTTRSKDDESRDPGDQALNSKNPVVIFMCEALERKERKQNIKVAEVKTVIPKDEKRDDFVEGIIEGLKDFAEGRCTVFKDDDELEAHLMSL